MENEFNYVLLAVPLTIYLFLLIYFTYDIAQLVRLLDPDHEVFSKWLVRLHAVPVVNVAIMFILYPRLAKSLKSRLSLVKNYETQGFLKVLGIFLALLHGGMITLIVSYFLIELPVTIGFGYLIYSCLALLVLFIVFWSRVGGFKQYLEREQRNELDNTFLRSDDLLDR
ncbi:MAG: hypothetical protein ACI837_001561 [Crocinitomicaceae bacterium]|jgi:hypothetical protein